MLLQCQPHFVFNTPLVYFAAYGVCNCCGDMCVWSAMLTLLRSCFMCACLFLFSLYISYRGTLFIVMAFWITYVLVYFSATVSVLNMPPKRKQSTQPRRSTRARQTSLNPDIRFVPDDSLPIGPLPAGTLPAGTRPAGTLPAGTLPAGTLPAGTLPAGTLPAGTLPAGTLPAGTLPAGTLPAGTLPAGNLLAGSLPVGTPPAGTLPAGTLLAGTLPAGTLPAGNLLAGSLPAGTLPAGTNPSGVLPQASALPTGTLPAGGLPAHALPVGTLTAGTLPTGTLTAGSNPPGALPEVSALPPSIIGQIATEVSRAVSASLQPFLGLTQHGRSSIPPCGTALPGISLNATADAAVQGSVASALRSVTGMPLQTVGISQTESRPPSVFNSMTISIDARLDPKIKAKIWSNEYFDFGQLLHSAPAESQYNMSIATANGSSTPTLCLEPTNKAKSISSIEVWTSAFQVFVGVYTSRYPLEGPALMKYSEVVRDLAARGCDWRYYDTNFRYLRQQNPTSMPWGVTHWELWIRSQHFFQGGLRSNPPQAPTHSSYIPKGYCRKFHSGATCPGCSYKHECHKCGSMHPSTKCNFRAQHPRNLQRYPAAKSKPSNTNPGK